jgi:hypothetical protein
MINKRLSHDSLSIIADLREVGFNAEQKPRRADPAGL